MHDPQVLRNLVDKKLASLDVARRRVKEEATALQVVEERLQVLQEAQAIAQAVAQQVQEQAHKKIASVVSRSLEAVFDKPYTFRIVFEQKRGRTEARLVFEREGLEVDPMTASGGGMVDVAAFSLRLSCLMLSRPPLRRVLVMDEPFKCVHKSNLTRLRTLLGTLSKEMGVQFLMVTHLDELKTGNVIELE